MVFSTSIASLTHVLVVVLSLFTFVLHQTEATADHMGTSCYNTSANYMAGSEFERNLYRVVSSLYSDAIGSIFSNSTNGDWPNQVHGLFLCKPDSSPNTCQDCIKKSSDQLLLVCAFKTEALIWYDDCLLCYWNISFFGKIENISSVYDSNKSNEYSKNMLVDLINEGFNHATIRYGLNSSLHNSSASQPPSDRNENSSGNGTKKRTIIIVSLVLSVVLITMAAALVDFLYTLKKKRKGQENRAIEDGEEQHGDGSQEFPIDLVITATKNFSELNKLGEGGFGSVYKGTLADGNEIAVKRLSKSSSQGLQEFKNEVTLIARLQHRNLVKLLGCCLDGNESLLIYEYMPNKSLDLLLFDSNWAKQLDWSRRFNIIDGIARGLLYLHEDSRLRIIHRDLKASNILLDYEMNPKISDFGMARIFDIHQSEANTTRIVGTFGYMAPEYMLEGLFSIKSDVFSFGVLLLEIISGKRNGKFDRYEPGKGLLSSAWEEWMNDNGLAMMDPSLMQTFVASQVLKCLHIGLLCVQIDPADRPTMSNVVLMLRSDRITLPQPRRPTFPFKRGAPFSMSSSSSHDVKAFSSNEITISNIIPR